MQRRQVVAGATRAALALSLLGVTSIGQAATRQDTCGESLVESVYYYNFDDRRQLDYLNTVTEDNFDARKKAAGGKLKYKDLDLGGTYDEFESKVRQLFNQLGYKSTSDIAFAELRSWVPKENVSAWQACKIANSKQTYGVHAWVERESPDTVTVAVHWHPQPPRGPGKIEQQTLVGGKVPGLKAGSWMDPAHPLSAGGGSTVIIQREKGREMAGTITVNGVSDSFYVAPPPPAARYAASIAMTAEGVVTKTYEEDFLVHMLHTKCQQVKFDRAFNVCSKDSSRRPVSVASFATQKLPDGTLPKNHCFQAVGTHIEPGALAHCAKVNVSYQECHIGGGLYQNIDFQRQAACHRGLGVNGASGTPIDLRIAGTYDEGIKLARYKDSAPFLNSRTWTYPAANIAPGVKDLKFQYVVNVVDLNTGATTVLDNETSAAGGFKVVASDGGRSVVLLQEGPPAH